MPKSSSSVSVLHITDSHIGSTADATLLGVNTAYYFQKVVDCAFKQYTFDIVLMTGDLAQDPCVASYQYIRNTLADYNTPCIALPGNHDDYDIMQHVFNTEAIHCRKQVLLDNTWQLISLNSQIIGANSGYLNEQELTFLTQCLANNPDKPALIAVHHHCLEIGSSWMDTMIIKNHDQLFATLAPFPQVKAIIHGHTHQHIDKQSNGIRVLGTPSTCFQFKPACTEFALDDTSPGFRVITLHANGNISTEVIRLPGPLIGLHTQTHGY